MRFFKLFQKIKLFLCRIGVINTIKIRIAVEKQLAGMAK